MLGDQLIKNERIALVELIKNAYDADASWVKVSFEGFTSEFEGTANSKIVIEDNGTGMTRDTIENHWVNPATPIKLIGKKTNQYTSKGRAIQGEKGIGRFALLKLGRTIEITTRTQGERAELRLKLDLSDYNADFIAEGGIPLFLDDVRMTLAEINPPKEIVEGEVQLGIRSEARPLYGTRIEISHLSNPWSRAKVDRVYRDLVRLQSIFSAIGATATSDPFDVSIFRDGVFVPYSEQYKEKLENLIQNNTVLKIEAGRYDEQAQQFKFLLNGTQHTLRLDDPEITGLSIFRDYFGKQAETLRARATSCGPFQFAFYVFDFSADAKGQYHLDGVEKQLIKEHRIYLYRDGIRVYPYGDPEDDWLGIDIYRGTVRASGFLSNDQVVGYVNITQAENPKLRDKTNREGLIDEGDSTADFMELLRVILAWARKKPYAQYRAKAEVGRDIEVFKGQKVQQAMDAATAASSATPEVKKQLAEINKLYQAERKYLVQRAETTEHLAGVGLSVETASHDLMSAMHQVLRVMDALITQTRRAGELNKEAVFRELTAMRGMLSFIQQQIQDLQLLFKSTKQRRKDIRVKEILEKVLRLFATALDRDRIKIEIDETRTPLIAKTTDAVLLQVFLNLFDNAIYWLKPVTVERKILIALNGDDSELIFSDNGPGVKGDDAPYIFEPFYSGRGDEGRGLGLYIARQLLERHEYSIELADLASHRLLSGANFVVSFVRDSK
jgi:signal transduction histidine kinase